MPKEKKTCIIIEFINALGNRHIPCDCYETKCSKWDDSRGCCSFNTKPRCEITHISDYIEESEISVFTRQLKSNIDLLLEEKTGWGRVELKKRLLDLIDATGQQIYDKRDDDIPF